MPAEELDKFKGRGMYLRIFRAFLIPFIFIQLFCLFIVVMYPETVTCLPRIN